jgi:hypothetical protein
MCPTAANCVWQELKMHAAALLVKHRPVYISHVTSWPAMLGEGGPVAGPRDPCITNMQPLLSHQQPF